MLNIRLKDGRALEYEENTPCFKIAGDISEGLARAAVGAKIDGTVVSLDTPVTADCELSILTFDDSEGKDIYRHTVSHVLAQAVKRLYPKTKLAIGPAIENGFYYDFDSETVFTSDILEKLEGEMKKIIKEKIPLERFELPRNEALELVRGMGESYKEEIISDLDEDAVISFYRQGEFTDLCAGPHLQNTGKLKNAFKLTSCTGAYWRGDSSKKMLQRIYGTAFYKKEELDEHLARLEEAAKRDHRKLGRELDLFGMCDEGPGFPFFYPKGIALRNALEEFWRQVHDKWDYEEIRTPIVLNEELWHRSGHWDHYKENMYFTNIDEEGYAIKPMNCPGGMLAYKRRPWSYRDLPLRMAEMGLVHRHELSGALHGLMRVRAFTQDDAHIFMTSDQIGQEVGGIIDLIDSIYKTFGFEYHVELSTCPEKFIGSDEVRHTSEAALLEVLKSKNVNFVVNPGDGAFYGPKIDFHLRDCIGRTWQCGTIQLDFEMPERFDLVYTGSDGEKHRPVMVHRAALGSIERFIAILTEHFAGAFPCWLAPVQIMVIPITDRTKDYAKSVEALLKSRRFRVEGDYRSEKLGYKIREAQTQKIPYMLVVGDKEAESGTVAVRNRSGADEGSMTLDAFIEKLVEKIKGKTLD